MKSGYTLITTLGLMILLSGLVVGMNSLVSGSLRKSGAVRNAANADFAAESALELSKAIVLGNITLSVLDERRVKFNGTPLVCSFASDFNAVLKIEDVAGLVDLRFSSDQLLSSMLRGTVAANVSNALISEIRKNANSGEFVTSNDVLLASGLSKDDAERAGSLSTIHGRHSRLARDVTAPELAKIVSVAGVEGSRVFGSSPSNKTFKVEAKIEIAGKALAVSQALITLENSGGVRLRKVFEKRFQRRRSSQDELLIQTGAQDSNSVWCSHL